MPPCTLRVWLNQFLENGESVFTGRKQDKVFKDEIKSKEREIEELHKTIGQLTVTVNWIKKKYRENGLSLNGINKKSVNFINKTCKAYPDKKIVVVSHHAPSINCISEEYKADMLSAVFASNLEWIMKENDNLVLWCHGHVHSDVDFAKYRTRVC